MRRTIAATLAALGLLLAGCASQPASPASPAAAPSADDPRPLVAFYGDSYTRGTGASTPDARWSTRLAEDRGWAEYNPSVNGLGFVNNRRAPVDDLPGQIIAVDPDIVIVTMGLNDAFSYDARGTEIRDRIDEDFERLSTELPDARIVVVEPFWYTTERPESIDVIIGWVADAALSIGADTIPGASTWIQGRPGEMASDGLHPNDAGYDEIYAQMDSALADLGL